MRHALFAPLLLLAACGPQAPVEDPSDEPPADPHAATVDSLVAPLLRDEWLNGVAIALIDHDNVSFYGFGHRAGPDSPAPDADTFFQIGSVTKVFTALLLADAVQRGELALDAELASLLPETTVPSFEGRPLRLVDLASHSSGLPRMPPNFAPADPYQPYADYSPELCLEALASVELSRGPGDAYEYSNFGMGLLGDVLARRAGLPYPQLLQQRVLEPLALTDTKPLLSDADRARLAQGYDANGDPQPDWTFGGLAGAGTLQSTARDLARFVQQQAGLVESPLADAIARSHTLAFAGGPTGGVALGWHLKNASQAQASPPDSASAPTLGAETVLWHNGMTGGYASFVAFEPGRGIGVVVLANTASSVVDGLGIALHGMMRGDAVSPLELPPLSTMSEAELDAYVGVYLLAPFVACELSREGNRLYARVTGQARHRLFAAEADTFEWRVVAARVRFLRNESGQVDSLEILQDGQVVPGKRYVGE